MGRVSPNYYVQDGVVPRTRLPEVLRRIRELEARSGLRIGNVFHAGDGNLHPLICYDESIPGQAEHAEQVASEILSYCIEAGGAITGEHGVGADKKAYMPKMFTADDLDAMQLLRCAFDPSGICNPGKVFPTPRLCGEVPGPYRQHPLERAGLAERFLTRPHRRSSRAAAGCRQPRCPAGRHGQSKSRTAVLAQRRGTRNAAVRAAGRGRECHHPVHDGARTSPIDHCAGDLTATLSAGVTLAAVNATLARRAVAAARPASRRPRHHRRHRRHQRQRPAAPRTARRAI